MKSYPTRRRLTSDEIRVADEVFAKAYLRVGIDYDKVCIVNIRAFVFQPRDMIIAVRNTIYWPGAPEECTTVKDLGWLIHELAHVRQHQHGVNVLLRGAILGLLYRLSFGLYNPYIQYPDFLLIGARKLDWHRDLNIEASAEVLRLRWMLSQEPKGEE